MGYDADSWAGLQPGPARNLLLALTGPEDQRRKTARESEPELNQHKNHVEILLSAPGKARVPPGLFRFWSPKAPPGNLPNPLYTESYIDSGFRRGIFSFILRPDAPGPLVFLPRVTMAP